MSCASRKPQWDGPEIEARSHVVCASRPSKRLSFCRRCRRSLSPRCRCAIGFRADGSDGRLYGHPAEQKQEILETIELASQDGQGFAALVAAHRSSSVEPGDRPADQGCLSMSASAKRSCASRWPPYSARLGEGDGKIGGSRRSSTRPLQRRICRPEVETTGPQGIAPTMSACPRHAGRGGMLRTYLDTMVELPWALPDEKADQYREMPAISLKRTIRPRKDQAAASSNISRCASWRRQGRRRSSALSDRPASAKHRLASP